MYSYDVLRARILGRTHRSSACRIVRRRRKPDAFLPPDLYFLCHACCCPCKTGAANIVNYFRADFLRRCYCCRGICLFCSHYVVAFRLSFTVVTVVLQRVSTGKRWVYEIVRSMHKVLSPVLTIKCVTKRDQMA